MFTYTVENMQTGEPVFSSSSVIEATSKAKYLNYNKPEKVYFVIPVRTQASEGKKALIEVSNTLRETAVEHISDPILKNKLQRTADVVDYWCERC